MNNPKISIVTVCYNAVETIEKTILSVINQTYENIEYIIIDGASTDGTIDIINKYRDRIAYFISEPDKGVYDAMNKGVKLTSGDFVFFINSDDVFYDDNVLKRVSSSLLSDNNIYYGDVIFLPEVRAYNGEFSKKKLCFSNICHQSIFYPRKVFYKYLYDINYKLYADWCLNMKCRGDYEFKFVYLKTIISYFNTQGLSMKKDDINFYRDYNDVLRNSFGLWYYLYLRVIVYAHKVKSMILSVSR